MINAREISAAEEFDCVDAIECFAAKKSDCIDVDRFLDLNSEKDSLLCIIKAFNRVISDEICAAEVFEISYIFKSMFCD